MRLSQNLLDQLDDSTATHHHNRLPSRKRSLSRKDSRKQERESRKQRKSDYFASRPNKKRPPQADPPESPPSKRPRTAVDPSPATQKATARAAPPVQPTKPKPPPSKSKVLRKKSPSPPRSDVEDEEEKYISYLEGKLGLRKGSNKASKDEDGLDDLLDWANSTLRTSSRKKAALPFVPIESASESSSESEWNSEPEWGGIEDTVEDPSSSDSENEGDPQPPQAPPTVQKAAQAYIPPHLRAKESVSQVPESETTQKLVRQLKGLLNRMSEQNVASIVDEVERLYREYSRHDVTTTLTTLIIRSVADHSAHLDSFVVLYGSFIAALHKIIGIQFGAYIVQHIVTSYDQYYSDMQEAVKIQDAADIDHGKKCSNLLVLISELYNFQVIHSILVFDIIRTLLAGDLTEVNVELLLKVVQNTGQQLRTDDSSALKDIVNIVQGKAASNGKVLSSRTSFMIETVSNLKNSSSKRNTNRDQNGAVDRMRKFLSGLSKTKHIQAREPLRVTLEDLRLAETKGKWWLVGAAWSGNPLEDAQVEQLREPENGTVQDPIANPSDPSDNSADLFKLARAQGMNTDIRRGIFVTLMSSDDYVDACDRLSQLNLTEVQQREITKVALHCCGNERAYNPYYALVCQQLCRTAHSHKITLQFNFWDFVRSLGEANVGGAAVVGTNHVHHDFDLKDIPDSRLQNVARAYAWLIAKDAVSLLILKPIDFTTLKQRTRDFLKQMFMHIFINSQSSTPSAVPIDRIERTITKLSRNHRPLEEVFLKASRIPALSMGIAYLLSESFANTETESGDEFAKFIHWAVNVAKDSLQAGQV